MQTAFKFTTFAIMLCLLGLAFILLDHSIRLWRGVSVIPLPDHIFELVILLVVVLGILISAAKRS